MLMYCHPCGLRGKKSLRNLRFALGCEHPSRTLSGESYIQMVVDGGACFAGRLAFVVKQAVLDAAFGQTNRSDKPAEFADRGEYRIELE